MKNSTKRRNLSAVLRGTVIILCMVLFLTGLIVWGVLSGWIPLSWMNWAETAVLFFSVTVGGITIITKDQERILMKLTLQSAIILLILTGYNLTFLDGIFQRWWSVVGAILIGNILAMILAVPVIKNKKGHSFKKAYC